MQTHQRIVFGNMGGVPREEPTPPTQEELNYNFNTMVFEIASNWGFVTELMKRFKDGNVKQVDPLERDWLNFFIQNQVEIEKYENEEQFIESWLKNKE